MVNHSLVVLTAVGQIAFDLGFYQVREGGLEPPLPFGNQILSLARLPIPPHSRVLWLFFDKL